MEERDEWSKHSLPLRSKTELGLPLLSRPLGLPLEIHGEGLFQSGLDGTSSSLYVMMMETPPFARRALMLSRLRIAVLPS
jgi:hypothetical protein